MDCKRIPGGVDIKCFIIYALHDKVIALQRIEEIQAKLSITMVQSVAVVETEEMNSLREYLHNPRLNEIKSIIRHYAQP